MRFLIAVAAAWTAAACVSQSTGSAVAAAPRDIRALRILPESPRACPGAVVATRYVVTLGDGSTATLPPREVATLVRSGVAAAPRADGSWIMSAEPLESAVSGFRLSATLTTDSSVRADTVVAPRYDCRRTPIILPTSDPNRVVQAHVRIGTFPTPFYDSIVVAVLEITGRAPIATVLAPNEMRSGAITVQASGMDGRPGRNGRAGRMGGDCANGEDGEDGGPGESGQLGGQVDIIVQHDSPWLADLIVVQNTGGRGGAGGAGGRAGPAGPTVPRAGGGTGRGTGGGSGGGRCTTNPGRTGANGTSGAHAGAGPASKTTSVLYPLLWPGSPIWSDSGARRGMEALIVYEAKVHR